MALVSKTSLVLAAAGAAIFAFSVTAQADETTTTTRTTREDPSGPGVVIGVPGVVGVEVGRSADDGGCTTKRMTRTDEETGESVTRERTNCE